MDATPDRGQRWAARAVLVAATLALVATSAPQTELTDELPFTLPLGDLAPVEISLDLSGSLFDRAWREAPTIGVHDLRFETAPTEPVGRSITTDDLAVRLDPVAPTDRAVTPVLDGDGLPTWTVLPDACPDGCVLRFVLRVEGPADVDLSGARLTGRITALMDVGEGSFPRAAIPDDARFTLTAHDGRFRPVPEPAVGLDGLVTPSGELVPTTVLDEDTEYVTFTRPPRVEQRVVGFDARDVTYDVRLTLLDGQQLRVPAHEQSWLDIFADCPSTTEPCVRSVHVDQLVGELRVAVGDEVLVEPGPAGNPLPADEEHVAASITGVATLRTGRPPVVLDHELVAFPPHTPTSVHVPAGATVAVEVHDPYATVRVRFGDAVRIVRSDLGRVVLGSTLAPAWADVEGEENVYTAPVPFELELVEDLEGDDLQVSWEIEARVLTWLESDADAGDVRLSLRPRPTT